MTQYGFTSKITNLNLNTSFVLIHAKSRSWLGSRNLARDFDLTSILSI
nr:MAG TPA: hypothetical protein [Caudoviricetes sp.]